MDIQTYISSGVLETYVLGELSASEARQVEEMAARHPEVQEELRLIEETLEAVVQSAAIEPRPALRDQLMAQIVPTPSPEVAPTASQEAPVRPLYEKNTAGPQQWLAAASIGLAVISSLAAAYFWSRWQSTEEQLASMLAQNTVLVQHVSTLENSNETIQQTLAVYRSTEYRTVPMNGQAPAPNAQAIVHWHPEKAEVYLNPGTLPKAPAGKQYQLWAIVDGKPVDAGVFDVTGSNALQQMKQIRNASAFAVTLEPAGGSAAPTMEQMYVMGAAS